MNHVGHSSTVCLPLTGEPVTNAVAPSHKSMQARLPQVKKKKKHNWYILDIEVQEQYSPVTVVLVQLFFFFFSQPALILCLMKLFMYVLKCFQLLETKSKLKMV